MNHYPKDPVQARFERDVHFRSLVSMLEATLHDHQFSPSELRDACILAATRYEMRVCRRELVFSDGEIAEFLRRTDRDEAGERAIDAARDPRPLAELLASIPREK